MMATRLLGLLESKRLIKLRNKEQVLALCEMLALLNKLQFYKIMVWGSANSSMQPLKVEMSAREELVAMCSSPSRTPLIL